MRHLLLTAPLIIVVAACSPYKIDAFDEGEVSVSTSWSEGGCFEAEVGHNEARAMTVTNDGGSAIEVWLKKLRYDADLDHKVLSGDSFNADTAHGHWFTALVGNEDVSGPDPVRFVLEPGASRVVDMLFAPGCFGGCAQADPHDLHIDNDFVQFMPILAKPAKANVDLFDELTSIELCGQGLAPVAEITTERLDVDPQYLYCTDTSELRVTNKGRADLLFEVDVRNDSAFEPQFEYDPAWGPDFTLPPGESMVLRYTFQPVDVGPGIAPDLNSTTIGLRGNLYDVDAWNDAPDRADLPMLTHFPFQVSSEGLSHLDPIRRAGNHRYDDGTGLDIVVIMDDASPTAANYTAQVQEGLDLLIAELAGADPVSFRMLAMSTRDGTPDGCAANVYDSADPDSEFGVLADITDAGSVRQLRNKLWGTLDDGEFLDLHSRNPLLLASRGLQIHRIEEGCNADWRDDAGRPVHLVLISDRDSSDPDQENIRNVESLVLEIEGTTGRPLLISHIAALGGCGEYPTRREAAGGQLYDLCADDWSQFWPAIADAARSHRQSSRIELSDNAIPESVRVTGAGELDSSAWYLVKGVPSEPDFTDPDKLVDWLAFHPGIEHGVGLDAIWYDEMDCE